MVFYFLKTFFELSTNYIFFIIICFL